MHNGVHPGQPPKDADSIVKKVTHAYSLGLNQKQACAYAGVSDEWLRTKMRDDPSFVETLNAGLATRVVGVIEKVITTDAGRKWWLERILPDQWSPNEVHRFEALKLGKLLAQNGRV
jgi:hypothetical protein